MKPLLRERIVDSFAGGGGASTGIEMALGVSPDIAINHDGTALAMHAVNHPKTKHLAHNIWKVDPSEACEGQPVGLLWASPDCKHFSKAKGGKPVNKNIRDLAWVVVRWAKQVSPRVIILENVEEFQDWGPVLENGMPCLDRKGLHFRRFIRELRELGYKVDWRELRAADYGTPTVRKRLFLIARRDGLPIIWPAPTHGEGRKLPWRTAAEIIDWSLPCPSIFDTSKEIMAKHGLRAIRPLAPNTMARIARGVKRYVIDAAEPFIVPVSHSGDTRVHGLDEPLRTITSSSRSGHALVTPFVTYAQQGGRNRSPVLPLHTVTASRKDANCVVVPTLIQTGYGERRGQSPRVPGLEKPLGTCVDGGKHALVTAFLAQHNTDMVGHDCREALSTIVGKGCTQAVVSAGLINLKGSERRQSKVTDPAPTQCAGGWHVGEVRAFLMKYYGTDQDPQLAEPLHTQTTKDRFSLVTVMIGGEPYAIVDIGMRMLTPRELFRAQGFPETYILDRTADGTPINKTDQIRMCGNSVCPQVAEALVAANYQPMQVTERGVPAFAFVAAE